MNPKINKNGQLDFKVPVGCPPAPWTTKMVTQDAPMEPPGLQINTFGINFSTHPITNCLLPQGAGGRGEALRYIYIYIFTERSKLNTIKANERELNRIQSQALESNQIEANQTNRIKPN